MSDWHLNFGMTEEPSNFLSWGFGYIKKIISKIIERAKGFLYGPEKFTYTIEIRGSILRPFIKMYIMLGTVIGKWIKEFIVRGDLLENYQSEDIIVAGDLVRPIAKSYDIKGKRGIMHIINFLLDDEDDE